MDAEYFRFIYDYLYWARDKVLTAAEGLSEVEYTRDVGFTYHSVRGILTHALAGEAILATTGVARAAWAVHHRRRGADARGAAGALGG